MFKLIYEYVWASLWQWWWPIVGGILTVYEVARRTIPPRSQIAKAMKWTPRKWMVVALISLVIGQFLAYRDLKLETKGESALFLVKIASRDKEIGDRDGTINVLRGANTVLEQQLTRQSQRAEDLSAKLADARAARPLELKAPPGGLVIHTDAVRPILPVSLKLISEEDVAPRDPKNKYAKKFVIATNTTLDKIELTFLCTTSVSITHQEMIGGPFIAFNIATCTNPAGCKGAAIRITSPSFRPDTPLVIHLEAVEPFSLLRVEAN